MHQMPFIILLFEARWARLPANIAVVGFFLLWEYADERFDVITIFLGVVKSYRTAYSN